jgi:ADP-ribosylglycohydrolase
MLLTSLIADSLALGPHWIYDRSEIASKFTDFESLQAPVTSYHPGKQAGDQTHLGDQTKILAESLIATQGEPDAAHFMAHWNAFWANPETKSYRDKATKSVLETQNPSSSTEIAGIARTAPLAALLLHRGFRGDDLASMLYAHVSLTHQSQACEQATQLLAGLLTLAIDGKSLLSLIPADPFPNLTSGEAIERIGQSCDLSAALPASLLLLRRYAADPKEALIQNALAGGDSAARGLFIGMILGVTHPTLPSNWVNQLRAKSLINQFRQTLV